MSLFIYFFLRGSDAYAWNTYQTSNFYKVETLCRDVINDLSVMKFDAQSGSKSWIEQMGYISDQLVALQEALCNLLENEEEARIYLKEDYAYLSDLFMSVEERFNLWNESYPDTKTQRAIRVCLQRIMQENRKNLQKVIACNREINAYDIDFFSA